MSRAEMAIEWLVNLYTEFFGFFGYYISSGMDLWGDWLLGGLIATGLVTSALCFRIIWNKSSPSAGIPSVQNNYDRFMHSLFFGFIWGFPATIIFSWWVVHLLLGFFFGPIKP